MRGALVAGVLVAALAGAARADPVYFNHALVVTDAETYAALQATPFLKQRFSVAEARSTVGDGGAANWSGFYLYGRSTYLEFMPQGEALTGQAEVATAALGMWTDRRETLPAYLAPLSRAVGAEMVVKTRTRRVAGADIDWFQYTDWADPKLSPDSSDSWLMAPFADYLTRLHPEAGPELRAHPLTRASNNAFRYDPHRLFRDVVAIRMTVQPQEARRIAAEMAAYGERVTTRGRVTTVSAPECRIVLTAGRAGDPYVTTFDIALNPGPHPKGRLRIGRSTLSFERHVAHWRFGG